MMAPQYLCCLYLATAGQQGNNLGSDEEEIVLLIYVIIDVTQNEVIGARQYLVKPSVADVNGNVLSEQVQMNSLLTEEMVKTAGQPLATVIYEFDRYLQSVLDIKSSTTAPSINGTTQQTLPLQQQNGQSVPLHLTNFQFITDGQLPLRQCLHPECCSKNIELNDYYTLFFDLRKEVHKYLTVTQQQHGLNGSQIVAPPVNTNSMNNLLAIAGEQQQIIPMPTNITEMIEPLGIKRDIDNEFYIKEAKDMVNIVKTLISNGHRFENPETVNLVLEPGICLKSDKIESNCVVRARGLPWQSSDQDIAKFFIGLNIAKGGVALCLSAQGRRNGEALVRFCSQEHRDLALKRHKHHMGTRYIEVYEGNGDDFIGVAGGSSNEAQAFLSKGAAVIIRMRGLPYDCTAQQVLDFFSGGEHPCHVLDGTDGVLFVKKGDGRSTGDAFVLFAEEADSSKALSKHRELIGSRYIELFRSTTAEVQQVLNRSMELQKYHGVVNQMPQILPHQLPPLPLLPQHIITSGTRKDCIRLRGLPYEAQVEHILEFLGEFAKNIVFQGVHMVYSSQGSPSGEAFIQMDSEKSAGLAAQQKHNRFMFSGKKHRYIEVFQCSGEDMNLVLNGGIPAPVSPRKGVATALISPGILPAPAGPAAGPTAGQPPTVPQINTTVAQIQQNLVTPNPALTWENPALYAQQQAQMIAQQNMLIKQHIASAQLAAIQAAQAQQQSELVYINQFNNTTARQLPQGLFPLPGQPALFQHQSSLLPPNFQFTQTPQHPFIYLPGAPRLSAPPQFQQPHSQMIGLKPPLIPSAAPPPLQAQPPVPTMIPQFIYQNSFVPTGGKRSYGDAFTPATTESSTPSKRVANYANNVYTSVANSQIPGTRTYGQFY